MSDLFGNHIVGFPTSGSFFEIPGQFQENWQFYEIPEVFQDKGQFQGFFQVCANTVEHMCKSLL